MTFNIINLIKAHLLQSINNNKTYCALLKHVKRTSYVKVWFNNSYFRNNYKNSSRHMKMGYPGMVFLPEF